MLHYADSICGLPRNGFCCYWSYLLYTYSVSHRIRTFQWICIWQKAFIKKSAHFKYILKSFEVQILLNVNFITYLFSLKCAISYWQLAVFEWSLYAIHLSVLMEDVFRIHSIQWSTILVSLWRLKRQENIFIYLFILKTIGKCFIHIAHCMISEWVWSSSVH